MKRPSILSAAIVLLLAACGTPQPENTYADYPIQSVNLNQVSLTDNFWLPKIETIQKKAIAYAFDKCESEGRFENFVTAGKVMRGGKGEYIGVMPFDDTDVYKIIEGAAYSLISAPDAELEAYVDSVIGIVAQGQEPDGYLTTWRTIMPDGSPCSWVEPGPRWSYLQMSHELYNAGHLYEAAAAHYHATGKRNFLDIALRNADLIVEVFGAPDYFAVPGHQVIETGLVKLYQITGKEDYLLLSKKFLDLRGDKSRRKVFGDYWQDHRPVTEQDEAVGHAVRAVYMYAGMADIAAIFNDKDYLKAIHTLFDNVTNKKVYVTGGLGARHQGESFGDNYELPNLTAYSETCAAIGGVYWYDRMFRLTGKAKYHDILEHTLYNALIAGISLEGTEYFYPCALESDGEYQFNRGHCTRAPWFDCSCCPSNLMRFIPSVPNLIYATGEAGEIYVNLFISNQATIPVNGKKITIEQETNYPWEGTVKVKVKADSPQTSTLKFRIPGWTRNEVMPGALYSYKNESGEPWTVSLNGESIEPRLDEEGYLSITREWTDEQIELNFPMPVRQVVADEKIEGNRGLTTITRGPLVYCMEEVDNPGFDKVKITPATTFTAEKRPDLLNGVHTLISKDPGESVCLVPYYAWSNRGVNRMKVWLP
ncbi:beta-L-arabinofuranosidase domain-containing protein [Parabacteroides sp. PF5-6]|uniref:glycoside hydrolase family 127 protein n=1 Tax=Parabacteroides sp. PF5-6 TaxID=1742403 RepID=UPI0024055D8C|nr:beta-L-arabinofuranosidase domain-containing protein [Parabacteroides sp. PF5-6]MDF9830124.1 DUF1680 family protein [Parabacteroides sp. PF5-6]